MKYYLYLYIEIDFLTFKHTQMKPMKVTITYYTKSVIASIQYGEDPTDFNYDLDTNAKGFALELMRIIEQGAIITIEKLDYKN